jgi:hypothetical protein
MRDELQTTPLICHFQCTSMLAVSHVIHKCAAFVVEQYDYVLTGPNHGHTVCYERVQYAQFVSQPRMLCDQVFQSL